MAVFRTVIRSDLQKPLVVQQLSGNMFTADNASNEIAVEVTNGGEPVALSGAVTAYAVRADGVTAMFSGTINGNVASVILPASCYVEVGTLSIVIKVGTTTVGACTCYVYRTTTDEIVDPGHVIPSIDELLEQIEACRTATANANTAATNANTAASNANAKAALADEKATLADQKATLANTAAQNADTKASLADTAATNANTKAGLANDAATLANTKAVLADEKANLANTKATLADTAATNANTKAGLADTAAQNADAKATLANNAATLANTKAGLADTAATNANTAAGKIDNMTVAASGLPEGSAPIATISEVDGHKHIAFQIPKGDKGKDFHIAFTFASIAAMEAYSGDIELYDYAMIDTGSVQDADTGKLYCYEQDEEWHYIGDLSGAQGIKGETGTGIDHVTLNNDYTLTIYYDDGTQFTTTSIRGATGITPNIAVGTVTTLLPDQQAYVTRDPSSTAENPVFNFGIPKGETGSVENVYGTTVPMSESDSTSVYNAIGEKLDKDQGAANAGKFMKVGADGELTPENVPDPTNKADKVTNATDGNFAGLDATGNLTDSGKSAEDFAGAIYKTATPGSIITIEDGADDLPIKELKVGIEPVQDLNGYDFPWPAGGGKNLMPFPYDDDRTTIVGVTVTVHDDGTITFNGTPSGGTMFFNLTTASFQPITLAPGTYTLSNGGIIGNLCRITAVKDGNYYTTTDANTGYVTFTLSESGVFNFYISTPNGTAMDNLTVKPQLENGSTATSFVPYSNVCPISGWDSANVWDDPAYGGLIKWNQIIKQDYSFGSPYTANGITYIRNADGSITANGTVAGYTNSYCQISNNVDIKVDHKYYVNSGGNSVLIWYNGTGGISAITEGIGVISVIANGFYLRVNGTGTQVNETVNPIVFDLTEMFGAGNEPTTVAEVRALFPKAYYSYNSGEVTTVSAVNGDPYRHIEVEFPSEAGTVYGGTLNQVTGELVVDRGIFTVTSEKLANCETGWNNTYGAWVRNLNYGEGVTRTFFDSDKTVPCSFASCVVNNRGISSTQYRTSFYAPGWTSYDDFENAVESLEQLGTPMTYVAPIHTPVTYQLTAQEIRTLLGVNNIWADTVDVTELIYPVNTDTAMALYEKADKVANATVGNFAALDAEGNLKDSGKKPGDFLTEHQDISGKADKVSGATNGNFAGLDANGNLTDSGKKAGDFLEKEYAFGFDSKTWNGLTNFDGTCIWTDGENIYYSYGSQQYVLDKSTGTWSPKTWNGTLTSFYGDGIWSDGTHIYYSYGSQQHELVNKEGSYWYYKTWYGIDSLYESTIWTDGDNIYSSSGSDQRVLDKANSTWNTKTWNGNYPSNGEGIWTDGENIYYNGRILDKSTSTWSDKAWSGLTDIDGKYIWTDGENIYYSNGSQQYVLDKSTSTWSVKEWSGLSSFSGQKIWTDGENYYYSSGSSQYVLDNALKLYLGQGGTFEEVSAKKFLDDNVPAPDLSGKVDKNQGTENAGKALGINNQGQVVPVPFSGEDFTGATAASAGTHGYVPAPQITDMTKFLCGDGTWADVTGGKLVTFELDEVIGTGGSYGHITYISSVTHDMKAVLIEVSDPDVFLDEITISCMDGGIALSCDDVNGTSTVTVSCLFKANPDNITSSEFDVLANRIGTLGNLQTNEKSNLVGAVNELYDDIAQTQDGLGISADGDTHEAVGSGQFVYVRNHETLANGLYKANAAISANGALSTSNLTPDGSGGLNALKGDIDTLSSKTSEMLICVTDNEPVTNLAAGGSIAVTLHPNIPTGYGVLMFGPLRTNGFVGSGYISSQDRAWIHNPSSGTVNGTISVDFLCIKRP